MELNEETNCQFVSSRGVLKSCDVRSRTPISSIPQLIDYDFSALRPGASVYVCGTALPLFIAQLASKILCPYVLVSGDCDATIPDDVLANSSALREFLESPNLIHWFSQNCVLTSHPKLSQIPIGMDYHTVAKADHAWGPKMSPLDQELQLKGIVSNALPTQQRFCKAYANFQFLMTTKYSDDRREAIEEVPADLVYYEPHRVPRQTTWTNQCEYAFVISPHGNGLDCHRTWEAIALGCIPIVKTSPLDPLFERLPVLIVQRWTDVTAELLQTTLANFRKTPLERLNLSYWVNQIHSGKPT